MSEMYENEAMENENQEIEEVSEVKKSGSFKGKVIAFAAGMIGFGVGALVYKHNKKKAEAEYLEDEDFEDDDFEDEEILEELEAEVEKESSEEN